VDPTLSNPYINVTQSGNFVTFALAPFDYTHPLGRTYIPGVVTPAAPRIFQQLQPALIGSIPVKPRRPVFN
jgi:hypothetical protein